MSKQEIGRAAQGAGQVDLKQQDVAQLLKKKVVDQDSEAAAPATADVAAAEPVMVAAADSVFASDASVMVAGDGPGLFGGASTGTIVAVGAAIVGGGFLIAEATDDDDDGAAAPVGVSKVTPGAATANEGSTVTFTVEGSPGQSFGYVLNGVQAADVQGGLLSGTVVIGNDGKGFISVTLLSDGLTETPETLTVTVGGLTSSGVAIGDTSVNPPVELTAGDDNIVITGTQADVIKGTVDPAGAAGPDGTDNSTYTLGDEITGNGNTVLRLAVDSAGSADTVFLDNLAEIQLVVGNLSTPTVIFDAAEWTNVGDIELSGGSDGAFIFITDLEDDSDMTIASGIAGTMGAGYQNGSVVIFGNTGDGGASFIDDNITADVESGFTGFAFFSGTTDVVIGDVTMTAGDSASLTVSASSISGDFTIGDISLIAGDTASLFVSAQTISGDVTFGNVHMEGGLSSTAYFTLTDSLSGNITVGDVSMVVGDNGSAAMYVTATTGADIAIGDVSITAGDSTGTTTQDITFSVDGSGATISVGDVSLIAGDDYSASVSISQSGTTGLPGGDVTVGDITVIAGNVVDDFAGAYVYVYAYDSTGDVTVGDVTMAVGDGTTATNATLDMTISATDVTSADVGNMTIGNLDFSMGEDATGSVDIYHSNSATTSGMSVGSLTVGDINVDLGQDASLSISISQFLFGTSGGTMGGLTVGDLTANLAIGADLFYYIDASNTATGDLGDISIGGITAVLDDGASLDITFSFTATSGDIGSVSIGDMDITLGVGADMSDISITISADNIGDINIGDLTMFLGQSVTVSSIDYDITAATDIASVTFGDVNLTLDDSASVTSYSVSISAGGDIGSVVFGDHNLNMGVGSTNDDDYIGIYANDIGTVTFGDHLIELDASASIATISRTISASSDIGDVTFGDFDVSAHGLTNTALIQVDITAAGDIDSVSFGDISLSVDKSDTVSSTADLSFSGVISATGSVGEINVGLVSLATTVSATSLLNFTLVQIAGTEADIHIGGFAVSATSATTNLFSFNVAANTALTASLSADVTVDLIDVNVSATATGLFDLTDILAGVLTTGDIALGTVDYGDYVYAPAATPSSTGVAIDVSGFVGDIVVIGSNQDDTITDNTETNTLTGNDGEDVFSFVNGNTGLTAAAADKIVDFVHNEDLIEIDITATPTVDDYSEATYASFAAFLAGAETLNSAAAAGDRDYLHAGQVGTSVFIAIDTDQDQDVDFVIELQNASLTGANGLDFGDFNFV